MAGKHRRGNRGALPATSRFPAWAKALVTTLVSLPCVATEEGKRWVLDVLQAVAVHLQQLWGLPPVEPRETPSRRVCQRRGLGAASGDIEEDRRARAWNSGDRSEGEDQE